MAGVNKVILVGNLGKDPEVRRLESGVAVASFPLATTENYKDKNGERQSITEWHNIVLWRGLAEVAERFLKKGNSVYVEGKIRSRSYEDQDKNIRYITEIVGDNMTMLGGNGGGGQQGAPANQETNTTSSTTQSQASSDPLEDDLPF